MSELYTVRRIIKNVPKDFIICLTTALELEQKHGMLTDININVSETNCATVLVKTNGEPNKIYIEGVIDGFLNGYIMRNIIKEIKLKK